ncbi:MAG: hypothetical protein WCE60_07895 [Methanobacterium sp.]
MGGVNAKLKSEIPAEQPVEKLNDLELVITPKKEFLEWFRNTKVIIEEIKVNQVESSVSSMECPNCKSKMGNYSINQDPGELWHICSKCNISFSQRQHRYFTKMIMRLINEDIELLRSE